MKKAATNIISFGALTLIGLLVVSMVFVISENIVENANKEISKEFAENIFLLAESKIIEIETLVNYSHSGNEISIEIKEKIPEKLGRNSYTIQGKNNSLLFKTQNYGYSKIKNISWSDMNIQGICYSGNKEISLSFNSSQSNKTITLC